MSCCGICGVESKDDLFAYVTSEPVCSVCTIKHLGGAHASRERIADARQRLGLRPGEYLQHDRGTEAARILGRRQ